MLMEAVFDFSGSFNTRTHNPVQTDPSMTIEGGDVLVVREDILLIGNGARTSSQGIDLILDMLKDQNNGIIAGNGCPCE